MGDLVNKRVALLMSGCGKRGEDFPGTGSLLGFVATGNLATNNGRTQLPLRLVIGRLHLRIIEKRQQMVALFEEPLTDFLLLLTLRVVRLRPWLLQKLLKSLGEKLACVLELLGGQLRHQAFEQLSTVQQGSQL